MIKNIFSLSIILVFFFASHVFAGPPFFTDDPQPVDFMHWEFYIASQMDFTASESNVTLPHFEINYGLVPNLQIHLLTPAIYDHSNTGTMYGYSDTEVGAKYRFIDSKDGTFQAGTFPLILLPTGNKNVNLGNGKTQVYVPLWIQKSWGKLMTYGGGGYWYNPGTDNKNWIFTGWEIQYDFSETLTLGSEIYYHTADNIDAKSAEGFSVGGYINLNEHNHLLFSIGKSFSNVNSTSGYLGYQVTI